jgi:hypothetical protein
MFSLVVGNLNLAKVVRIIGMDFSGIFNGLEAVVKLMALEIAIGCIVGLIVKQVVKIKVQNEPNTQIFSPNDYTSVYFGKNFPRCGGDMFLLSPEFIVVRSEGNATTTEEFYNFLGARAKFKYEDGRIISGGFFLFDPVYLCTVVIPSLVGFFPSFIPFVSQYFSPLLYSGLAWMLTTFVVQIIIGSLKNAANNPR